MYDDDDNDDTRHIAGCNNSIRHIENRSSPFFVFLMQFRL